MRKATKEDLDSVVAIVKQAVPLMNAQGNFQWTDSYPLRSDFEKDLSRGMLWVAEAADGAVAGAAAITFDQSPEFASVGWDLSTRCVVPHRMVVHPSFRKSGIAARFMRQAEEVAVAEGCECVRVDTNENNLPMQGLLLKLGYECAGYFSFVARPREKFGMWKAFSKRVSAAGIDADAISIRVAVAEDVSQVMEIVNRAVPLMNADGNYQWNHTYPLHKDFAADVEAKTLWVAEAAVRSGDGAATGRAVAGAIAITFDQSAEYADMGWDLSVRCVVPHRMVVHPDYRKAGIARRLMLRAEEIAVSEGCEYVRVDTNEKNLPMQALFRKLGYQQADGWFTFKELPPEIYGDMRFLGFSKRVIKSRGSERI